MPDPNVPSRRGRNALAAPPRPTKRDRPLTPAILAALAALVALHDDALVVARINLSQAQQQRVSATLNAARAILEHSRTGESAPVQIAGDEVQP